MDEQEKKETSENLSLEENKMQAEALNSEALNSEASNTETPNSEETKVVGLTKKDNSKTLIILCSVIIVLLSAVLITLITVLKEDGSSNQTNVENTKNDSSNNDKDNKNDSDFNEDYLEYLVLDDGVGVDQDDNTTDYNISFNNYSENLVFSDIVIDLSVIDKNNRVVEVYRVGPNENVEIYPTENPSLEFTVPDDENGKTFDVEIVDFTVKEIENNKDDVIHYGVDENIMVTDYRADVNFMFVDYVVELTNFSSDRVYSSFIMVLTLYDEQGKVLDTVKLNTYMHDDIGPGETGEIKFIKKDLNFDATSYKLELINCKSEKIN